MLLPQFARWGAPVAPCLASGNIGPDLPFVFASQEPGQISAPEGVKGASRGNGLSQVRAVRLICVSDFTVSSNNDEPMLREALLLTFDITHLS